MWFEEIAEEIVKEHPQKDHFVVETGITPSGPIHVGHLREVLVAEGVVWALKKRGKKVRFIYFADTYDPLRRVYPFLPKSYQKYVGWPLAEIPAPQGKGSYSTYFVRPFVEALKKLGVNLEVIFADKFYKAGKMTPAIDLALKHRDLVARIIEEVSGRKLEADWQPFRPICRQCGRITVAKITKIEIENHRVEYQCECGHRGWADYSRGEGKLPWRVDWPARWWLLKVDIEPLGKDHFAAGSSYDVGQEIIRKVYDHSPPYPIRYEWIYLAGKGKMASSTGVAVAVADFLKIVPPQAVRYLIFRSQPMRHLEFHPGRDTIALTNELTGLQEKVEAGQASAEEQSLYQVSTAGLPTRIVKVPFQHLVTVYQAAAGHQKEIERLLRRSGHQECLKDKKALQEQIERVKEWLRNWAPEEAKFEIQPVLPEKAKKISPQQKKLLAAVIQAINAGKKGQELHNFIYETGRKLGLSPRETFRPLYLVLLGKDSGPKAGFFLTMLGKELVVDRLKRALKE